MPPLDTEQSGLSQSRAGYGHRFPAGAQGGWRAPCPDLPDTSGGQILPLVRYHVRRALGAALVLRIDPRRVTRHVGTNQPLTHSARLALNACDGRYPGLKPATRPLRKLLYSIEPFRLRQAPFDRAIPIEQEPRYGLLDDFIANRDRVERSLWFRRLRQALDDHGQAAHKSIALRSEAAILEFLNTYARDLVDSLERTGYDASRAPDTATALVDRHGAILKSDVGNHRFAAARILGAGPFPLEILGVHRDWYRRHVGRAGMAGLRTALRALEAAHRDDGAG